MPTEPPRGWHWARLGDLVARVTRKNGGGCTRVLTASGEHGLIDQQEYFNKSVAGRDLSKYFNLKQGEFAYNRSSMAGYPVGAIKRLDRYDEGVLSTLYICFALRENAPATSDFITHLFESGVLNDEIASITQVGARAHGLLNVKVTDFMEVSALLPPIPEQRKIAAILSSVDEAIQATQAVIEQTRRVKEGLLQDLLTRGVGHTRFKQTEIGEIPESWEVKKLGGVLTLQRGFDITQKEVREGPYPVVSSSGTSYYHAEYKVDPPGVVTGRKGKLGGVYFLEEPFWPHDTSLWVKDFKSNDPGFCRWLLDGLNLDQLDAATSVPTLNRNNAHKLKVGLPGKAEQAQIASKLFQIEGIQDGQVTSLRQHQQVKAGLLQDLLTGKVRVSA